MNSRDYKLFRAGSYYHVYNRGVNKMPIYLDERDYFNFLKRIQIVMGTISVPDAGRRGSLKLKPLPVNSFEILAYCLMPNHFHFIIKQNGSISIGDFIHKVCHSYAKYFNKKYERVGNLFQDTFKSKLIDSDAYLSYLTSYIHNNPSDPLNYPYSSLADYTTGKKQKISNPEFILTMFKNNVEKYKQFILGYRKEQEEMLKDYLFEE